MKRIIVAYDKARGIGANNDLLWLRDLPADLKHFKDVTMGGAVVMGRKTFESIGRALPGRWNIVISSMMKATADVEVVRSIEEAFALTDSIPDQDVWVIGGASIYEQALPLVDEVYATEVDATFENATVFFPALPDGFTEITREKFEADERNKYDYAFIIYRRRS